MGKDLYDVMVVGGGPGGSSVATRLAVRGWRVLLLDKARFPRDKVCGDFVSPRSLRMLETLGCGSLLEQAGPNRLTGASLHLGSQRITAGEIPQIEDLPGYGCTLPRYILDELIFRRARAVHVDTIEGCEVKNVAIDADGVTLSAQRSKTPCSFRGRLVIAADGAHSVVAKALGVDNRDPKSTMLALRAYYNGVEGDPSQAEISFDESFFPGYAWIFPVGPDRANVGLGMVMDVYQRYRINLRERLTTWIAQDPVARARLGGATLDGPIVGWPLNTYHTAGGNYADRVLLIGDAANFVDPINGEGIQKALESAGIAAGVADEALRADQLDARFLSRYEQRWRAAFDLDMRTADLIVTIIKNRSLAGVWLLILKMIGEKALTDRDYAATCGGILAGVVPTHYSLSPTVIARTLLHGVPFWQRAFGLSSDVGAPGTMDWALTGASKMLDAISEMAREPFETVEWGVDVLTRGLGVLAGLKGKYQDTPATLTFDEVVEGRRTTGRRGRVDKV